MFTIHHTLLATTVVLLVSGCGQLTSPHAAVTEASHSSALGSATKKTTDNVVVSKEKVAAAHVVPAKKKLSSPVVITSSHPVAFKDAAEYVISHSHKLLAAQAGWRASQLQAEALDDLHKPFVFVSGVAGRYQVTKDVSTARLRERLQNYGDTLSAKLDFLSGSLPPQLAQILGQAPSAINNAVLTKIPSAIHLKHRDDFSRANIAAIMPLYTGGRINAIQQLAHGRADVKASEVATTEEELLVMLIKRYFQVQLAEQVVDVRKAALKAIRAHDHAAQRMLDVGLIARVERLQGASALADAKFELSKAKDNLRLAQRALETLLQSSDSLSLSTHLFVNQKRLPPLSEFQAKARARYPAFAKIEAKTRQAEAMKSMSDASWKPIVNAFGSHEIGKDDNWIVGVNAIWTLHSSIDRSKMQQASRETLKQVNAIRQQAEQDVDLLVEKNWLSVNDARQRYNSLGKEEQLAQQVLKLNTAGFREGLNTVIEVNDAHAKLVKVRTERVNAAYEYVIALSELLAAAGSIHEFVNYISK